MGVTNLHPLYEKRSSQWRMIRDCVEGEDAIKRAGEIYLPKASGSTPEQYQAFMKRARWNNYLSQNLDGLHGLIFRRDPIITERDDGLKKAGILANIDRKGTGLYQFASDTTYDVMQTSFGGYLVDMPRADGPMTQEYAEKNGIRPYLRYYPAESIINWGYAVHDGVERLVYVVLQEEVENPEDEFSHTPLVQYRVLDLRSGIYVQGIFSQVPTEDGKGFKYMESDTPLPVIVNGETLDYIPFIMLPGEKPEKPMFYDLACCNVGHYQKTADYENGVHLTTIPTGYVTGHRQQEYEDGSREIVHLGRDSFLMFEEAEARVGTLVFSGEGLTHSEAAIDRALADMAILGSRLLVSEKGNESADSAKIHRAGENARLATFAKNMSEKLTQAVRIMADWMGIDTKVRVELCTDYDTLQVDANLMNAIANLNEKGKMPIPALYKNLKDGEILPPEMTLDIFATMLTLPTLGYSPIEQAKIYKQLVAGVNVELKEQPVMFNNQPPVEQTEEEDKEVEE